MLSGTDRRGDLSPEAVTDIAWQEFERKLRRYVGRRVDDGQADDLVGDILLRLVRSRGKLAAARNPSAWVYRVAANAITDHHRKHARERRAAETAALDAGLADPAGQGEPPGFAHCMIPMIEALPAPYGEALMLTEIEGMSQTAAAKKLGLSVSGMKSRVQRARKKLKASLLRCCRFEFDSRGAVMDYSEKASCASDCSSAGVETRRRAPAVSSSSRVP